MKEKLKNFLVKLLQWTWGFPQTLIGFIYYLYLRRQGAKITQYKGITAIEYNGASGYISLGAYLTHNGTEDILKHEYGHTIQSLILGPLYLLIIGLPSLIWSYTYLYTNKSYYWFYPEKWANILGGVEE